MPAARNQADLGLIGKRELRTPSQRSVVVLAALKDWAWSQAVTSLVQDPRVPLDNNATERVDPARVPLNARLRIADARGKTLLPGDLRR
jgi:hypothetical protein